MDELAVSKCIQISMYPNSSIDTTYVHIQFYISSTEEQIWALSRSVFWKLLQKRLFNFCKMVFQFPAETKILHSSSYKAAKCISYHPFEIGLWRGKTQFSVFGVPPSFEEKCNTTTSFLYIFLEHFYENITRSQGLTCDKIILSYHCDTTKLSRNMLIHYMYGRN